jgi:hypothetical protein
VSKQRKAPTGIIGARGGAMDCEWLTPEALLEPTRDYFDGPIPFDVATRPENPTKATAFFTKQDDALAKGWPDEWFCNPPFGNELARWLERIGAQGYIGDHGILVLPCSRYEQHYWQEAMVHATTVCWIRGRVDFIRASTGDAVQGNTYASCVIGFNVRAQRFARCYGHLGLVQHLMPLNEPPPSDWTTCKCKSCVHRRRQLACARKACKARNAIYKHTHTGLTYCRGCSRRINRENGVELVQRMEPS